MDSPSVSVVIPTRRRPDLVCRAVASVVAQTMRSIEIIVVVDGPDRETEEQLALVHDPRLRVVVNPVSVGASAARNGGVRSARGRMIAFLDDDDEWLPTKLQRQMATLESAEATAVGICQLIVRTPTADFIWPRRGPRLGEHISEYLFVRRSLFAGEGLIQTSMLVAPRQLLLEIPFDQTVHRYQEADWALRAGKSGARFVLTPAPLAVWHKNERRPTITSQHAGNWKHALLWIQERRRLTTARAYAAFLLVHASSIVGAAGRRPALNAIWREAWRNGSPGVSDVMLFFGKALLPDGVRSSLRRWFSGLRLPHADDAESPRARR